MSFPNQRQIRNEIQEILRNNKDTLGCFYFARYEHGSLGGDCNPHYYVNIPLDEEETLLLTIITTDKDGNQRKHYKNHPDLLEVDTMDIKCLGHDSFINCVNPCCYSINDLSFDIDYSRVLPVEFKPNCISDEVFAKILDTILNSKTFDNKRILKKLEKKYCED